MSNTLDNPSTDSDPDKSNPTSSPDPAQFPQIFVASRQMHTILPRSANNRRKYAILPTLGEKGSAILIFVLVVDALSSLTGVGSVVDRASLPVEIVVEFALEVERMVNVRKAELNVGSLIKLSASNIFRRLEY